jgi:hypothetical protein
VRYAEVPRDRYRPYALVQVSSPRVGWRKQMGQVLETWIELQHRFCERVGQVAYSYSERANVGLLAAAACCRDHVAIEEFATRKGNGWRGPGRIDLFIQIGKCALCLEAKTVRLRAPQSEPEWEMFWRTLRARLRAARHEAARAIRGAFRHRVGLLFCVLSTPLMRSSLESLRDLASSLDVQAPRQTIDFLAAYMPMSRLPSALQRYPGVIVAGAATRAARSAIHHRRRR